jgi:hypothetical protein
MYDTMVNLQLRAARAGRDISSCTRCRATRMPLVDELRPSAAASAAILINFAKLDFSKSKFYEFSGIIPPRPPVLRLRPAGQSEHPLSGYSIPIGSVARPAPMPGRRSISSPFMFNTVRRMTDTSLTCFRCRR